MRDREAPRAMVAGPHSGEALRAAADWQPVGGALAASIVIHLFAVASLGALFLSPSAAPLSSSTASTPLSAVLTGVPPRDRASESPPAPARTSKLPAPDSLPVRASNPREAAGSLPWSGTAPEIDPPPGLSGTAMVSEGLEYFETRNIVRLGIDIERRIHADYPDDPEYPVVLKPAETLGYPLDALAAGVEGTVLVWLGVDEEGKVIAKEVLDGPPELSQWVFERVDRLVARPAWNRDGPVRTWVALEIQFSRAAATEARAAAERK